MFRKPQKLSKWDSSCFILPQPTARFFSKNACEAQRQSLSMKCFSRQSWRNLQRKTPSHRFSSHSPMRWPQIKKRGQAIFLSWLRPPPPHLQHPRRRRSSLKMPSTNSWRICSHILGCICLQISITHYRAPAQLLPRKRQKLRRTSNCFSLSKSIYARTGFSAEAMPARALRHPRASVLFQRACCLPRCACSYTGNGC